MSNIRVFNFDISPDSVVGILAETGMPKGAWSVYLTGSPNELSWCYIADSEDPSSARFPFRGIWLTDGSEIYVLNANHSNAVSLQVLFAPITQEQVAPTQDAQSI